MSSPGEKRPAICQTIAASFAYVLKIEQYPGVSVVRITSCALFSVVIVSNIEAWI